MRKLILLMLLTEACAETKTARKPVESVPIETEPSSARATAPSALAASEAEAESAPVNGIVGSATSAPDAAATQVEAASNEMCGKLLDRYFDLTLAADKRAMGAPPEAIKPRLRRVCSKAIRAPNGSSQKSSISAE
jgi:hypothetical protein